MIAAKIGIIASSKNGAIQAPLGTLFLNEFTSSDYTTIGSALPTYNAGTSITLTGGATAVSDYIRYNPFISSRNNLKSTMRFTVDTFDASSYGIGLKMSSVNSSSGSQFNNTFFGVTSNNSEKGKIYFYGTTVTNTDGTPNDTTTSNPINVNLGNTIELIIEQMNFGFTMTMYNLTLDPTRLSPATHFYQMPTAYPFNNGVYHNTVKLGIAAFGGIQTVNYWKVETNEYEYCDLAVIGDSKTAGLGCTTVLDRFGALWQTNNPTKKISVFSGSSDKTNEVVLALSDIVASKPKKVIMFIGRNDIDNSIPALTWQANYQTIVNALVAVGSDVYHQLPTTEGVLNQAALTTFLNATYPGKTISEPAGWVAIVDNVSDSLNYIHPNTGGHLKLYNNQAAVISL